MEREREGERAKERYEELAGRKLNCIELVLENNE